jgi:hypothetical protein
MDNAYCQSWNLPGPANSPTRTLLQPEKEDDAEAGDGGDQVGKTDSYHGCAPLVPGSVGRDPHGLKPPRDALPADQRHGHPGPPLPHGRQSGLRIMAGGLRLDGHRPVR